MNKIENRLSKVLAAAGVASRRAAEELIFEGRVSVNGVIIKKPQEHVSLAKDTIKVDGKTIRREEKKAYYLLNKPKGVICSSKKVNRTRIVLDLFQDIKLRLFTVGRLDKDTEGLLIVTNDGHFAQRVIHPSASIPKEYIVKVNRDITLDHLKIIAAGTHVEGTFVKPTKVEKIRRGTVKIVVTEGKKHEVRHLIDAAKLEVLELKRVRIGGLRMGDLDVGKWRTLSQGEMESIFKGAS